jgi:hypothetical protein
MKLRIFHLVVILVCVAGYQLLRSNSPPQELIGMWTTSDPRYAGIWLEISERHVALHKGVETISSGRIISIETSRQNELRSCSIAYTSSFGTPDVLLLLYYQQHNRHVLYFKNEPDILWVKSSHI